VNVYWTETAVENLSAIYAYISQTSPLNENYGCRALRKIYLSQILFEQKG
jgi:hypothetical protein